MAEVAEAIGLGEHLRLSRGEDRSGLRRKSTVLSNTMEAVMGALFLDGGLEPVRAFVRRQVMGEAAEQLALELRSGAALGNYKSALQERLQAARAGTPVYRVKSESGPDHRKRFLVEVRLKGEAGQPGKPLARGMGSTKKLAEQDAARRALDLLASGALLAGRSRRKPPACEHPAPSLDAGPKRGGAPNEHPRTRACSACPAAGRMCARICPRCRRHLASLLQTVVVALFLLTFVLQPFLIPSESMEHTLLVGDFLLFNKQVYAPASRLSHWLLPYRAVSSAATSSCSTTLSRRCWSSEWSAFPGDRLRIEDGRVFVNGSVLDEPYAAFEPAPPNPFRDDFPARIYTDPEVDPDWWRADAEPHAQRRTGGAAGRVFCARRQPQSQQRFPLLGICAAPGRSWPGRWSSTSRSPGPPPPMCKPAPQQAADDRLGHDRDLAERLTGFARWKRIFRVVH